MADGEGELDAASLVDAAFGIALPKKEEPAAETEAVAEDPESAATVKARREPKKDKISAADEAEAGAAAELADTDESAQPEPSSDSKATRESEAAEPGGADEPSQPELPSAPKAKRKSKSVESGGAKESSQPEPKAAESSEADASSPEPSDQEPEPLPAFPAPALAKSVKLTRGRLAAAAAVVVGVAAASVVLFSGGGSGNAATPAGAAGALPSVNPQAFYPVQSASPFETGAKSALGDAEVLAAVPGCDGCKLVTRANGFTPDGGVLALFRTGEPAVGKSNVKLVVVGADGKLVWSAPDGFKALSAGIERFSVDGAGTFYLALPGAKSGQVLVALAWRDGKVQDIGGLLDPRIKSDSLVGVLPQGASGAAAATDATIVSQTTAGVPDAETGGLIESQYRIKDGAPVLVACRRHVGESGQWIAFQPSPDGCTHWPAGPVGPPDDDDGPAGPSGTSTATAPPR